MNSGGRVGTVFRPVGLWDEHPAADRERNGLGAGVGVPIVKEHTVPVLEVAALPANEAFAYFLCAGVMR